MRDDFGYHTDKGELNEEKLQHVSAPTSLYSLHVVRGISMYKPTPDSSIHTEARYCGTVIIHFLQRCTIARKQTFATMFLQRFL